MMEQSQMSQGRTGFSGLQSQITGLGYCPVHRISHNRQCAHEQPPSRFHDSEAALIQLWCSRQPVPTLVHHNGSALNISAKLDLLFKSAAPPTALLVAKPHHTFAVIIYLLKRGISVPDTVSLIARDHEYVFETAHPAITHYEFSGDAYGQRLSRLMIQFVNLGALPPVSNLFVPKFFEGNTVRTLSQPAMIDC